ncbi:hypothetical protein HAX54_016624 [Datura stramonium]|uniref:Uncharacterized protein n=1 Tax=Datura stramonium TaxID=4076 RepID=A0ABS8S2H0_DATST|nr:hypothetical protein [Datura stramonium]
MNTGNSATVNTSDSVILGARGALILVQLATRCDNSNAATVDTTWPTFSAMQHVRRWPAQCHKHGETSGQDVTTVSTGWHIATQQGSSLRILPGVRRLHPGATGHATRQQQCRNGRRDMAYLHVMQRARHRLAKRHEVCDAALATRQWLERRARLPKRQKI